MDNNRHDLFSGPKKHELTPCEFYCRLNFFIIGTILFLCFFIALIVLLIYPKGFTKQVLIQRSVTTLVSVVDTFYYHVKLSSSDLPYEAELGAVPCSSLKTYVTIHTGSPNGRNGGGHQQMDQLDQFAYLVSGSYINISITIISPPTSPNDPIYLYVFTLLESYMSFLKDKDTPPYFQRHKISSNNGSVTSVTIPVTETQFYFYGLDLPKGANYYYDYVITRVFYNASDYDFPCTLTSKRSECSLDLNSSSLPKHNEQCVLSYCNAIENNYDLFFPLQLDLLRKKLNVINCVIMVLAIVSFLLVLAIAMYDMFKRHVVPKINASCSHIFKRRQRHEGFKDVN